MAPFQCDTLAGRMVAISDADTRWRWLGARGGSGNPSVDFPCVHLYSQGNNVEELELMLRSAAIGKPVVIEEMASYVGPAETDRFLARTIGSAPGWFGFFDRDLEQAGPDGRGREPAGA